MTHITPRGALLVWLFLVFATLGGVWLVEHRGVAGEWTAVVVMAVAAVKARAVIRYFMEMRSAPLAWRVAFEAWVWVATALIVGLWFWAA